MSSPQHNKRAGRAWESTLRDGFRSEGFDYEELRLTGSEDEGDAVIRMTDINVVVEAKAGVMHPADFVKQAQVEAANFSKRRGGRKATGVAIVKRRGHNWKDAYVLTTVRDYFGLEG